MIKKINITTILAVFFALAVGFSSCAEEKNTSTSDIQRELLDAYIQVTYGENKPEKSSMGYYYHFLRETGNDVKLVDNTSWVKYDVVTYLKDGTIYKTTLEDKVKSLGIFDYSAGYHYIPAYKLFSKDASTFSIGAIPKDVVGRMGLGDSIRFIMPLNLAADVLGIGSQVFTGDGSYANAPIIADIVLRQVIDDPILDERRQLAAYRDAYYPGLDSLKQDFYFKVTKPSDEPADDTEEAIEIKDGTKVRYLYTGKFLDGFLFDSSVLDTIKNHHSYISYTASTHNDTLDYTIGSNVGKEKGLDEMLKNMKKGETAVAFFSSTPWGNGPYGKAGTKEKPVTIQSFTPLFFEVKLVGVEKGDKE